MPDDLDDHPISSSRRRRLRIGERVTINGILGVVKRPTRVVDAKSVSDNPAFDPNYESEQGFYNGPLWQPLRDSG